MTDRKRPLRWRKPAPDGSRYRRVKTIELWSDDVKYAVAQEHSTGLWFFYGMNFNTAHRPDTLENVKAEAVELANRMRASAVSIRD